MKRPNTAIKIDPSSPQSAIYALGKQDWNEQVGTVAAQRDTWRLVGLFGLAVAGIAVGSLAVVASQAHVVPYVVEVNKLGDPVAVGRADVMAPADPRVIRRDLARWVWNVRTVFTDVPAQRQLITDAYAVVRGSGTAYRSLNEWFSANSPFDRAKTETVGVQINSVIPLSSNLWQVQWEEHHRGRDGTPTPRQDYRAVIGISIDPPVDDAKIVTNPIGLWIESIDLQQLEVLGEKS